MNVQPQKRGRGRPPIPARREEVLAAALELFAERGFHGATMPEIAARAGIATGSIYRHFASKEQLVNELYRLHKRALTDALVLHRPKTDDVELLFDDLWWGLVLWTRANPQAFTFLELHHHGSYLDDESRNLERQILAVLATLIAKGRKSGALKKGLTAEALITTVWGAYCGMVKASRLGYYALTDAICSQVEKTCWDAIRNPDHPG